MRNYTFFFLFCALLLAGCTRSVNNEPQVSISEFVEVKKQHPQAVILDVRTPEEYNSGTMPDAININVLESSFDQNVSQFDKDATVMVFCKSGGRSAKAKQRLIDLGFANVVDLEGGIMGWKNAGGEIITPHQ